MTQFALDDFFLIELPLVLWLIALNTKHASIRQILHAICAVAWPVIKQKEQATLSIAEFGTFPTIYRQGATNECLHRSEKQKRQKEAEGVIILRDDGDDGDDGDGDDDGGGGGDGDGDGGGGGGANCCCCCCCWWWW